jgi:hypothetical protein
MLVHSLHFISALFHGANGRDNNLQLYLAKIPHTGRIHILLRTPLSVRGYNIQFEDTTLSARIQPTVRGYHSQCADTTYSSRIPHAVRGYNIQFEDTTFSARIQHTAWGYHTQCADTTYSSRIPHAVRGYHTHNAKIRHAVREYHTDTVRVHARAQCEYTMQRAEETTKVISKDILVLKFSSFATSMQSYL